ncbi:MAG TPA: hypothetical protein VIT38_00620 [Allosphingosinicella sp.]|jgi:hypothetical protein
MKSIIVAISAMLMAAPALAQSPPGTPGTPGDVMSHNGGLLFDRNEDAGANATAVPGDGRTCRRVEAGSGSRMKTRRLCLTAEGWRNRQRVN